MCPMTKPTHFSKISLSLSLSKYLFLKKMKRYEAVTETKLHFLHVAVHVYVCGVCRRSVVERGNCVISSTTEEKDHYTTCVMSSLLFVCDVCVCVCGFHRPDASTTLLRSKREGYQTEKFQNQSTEESKGNGMTTT